jgi:class 3 adenylate cyclase
MAVPDQSSSTRKLAAILSADIAGYSAMMGADEEGTVRKVRLVREAVLPCASLTKQPYRGSLSTSSS